MGYVPETNVVIYGLGAIGGAYAFFLSRSPNLSLSVIARSNYEAVKENGMKMQSMNLGEHSFQAKQIFKSAAEASEKSSYDYVLCAHKALHQNSAVADIKPLIKPHTTIVIAQNGVGNEDLFRETYPQNSIISFAIWIGADQLRPGEFLTRNREHTDLGIFPNPHQDATLEQQCVETLATLLKDGGASVAVKENIQIAKWEKLVCNIFWNPISALTKVNMGVPFFNSSEEAETFGKALMLDVIAVGRKAGVPLDDSLADKYIAFTKGLGSFQPSMLCDLKNGVPLEVDVIVGAPMRKARELGVDVPSLRAVYALVSALNGNPTKL